MPYEVGQREPRGSARSLNDMTSRENRTDTEMASEVSETSSDSVKKSEADAEASTPPKEEGAMRLFVGGVTPKSTFDSLIEYFQQWGPVKSIELMRDRKTGASRGFAFVTMERKADALEVIEATHVIDDKPVDVKPAVPKSYSGTNPCEVRKIYVGNVPLDATVQELADPFRAYGAVKEARIILDRETGSSRGFGFVTYEDPLCVEKLMEQHPAVQVKGNLTEYRRAQPKTQDTQTMTHTNRHLSKPGHLHVQRGSGSNWEGSQGYYAYAQPHSQGAQAVYSINDGARGVHANATDVVPVMYSYAPYSTDGSQYPGQMAATHGMGGYQPHQKGTIVTDPHSPPPQEPTMAPPPVAMPGAAGDYMMAPHPNPAYHHASAQAYHAAYQPYAMVPMYQQHQHHPYTSGPTLAHMEQFPVRQARELQAQRSKGTAGPSHVVVQGGKMQPMHVLPTQVQVQAQQYKGREAEYSAAVAEGGDNRYSVSEGDTNDVE